MAISATWGCASSTGPSNARLDAAFLDSATCDDTAECAETGATGQSYDPEWAHWPMPNAHVAGVPNWQSYDSSGTPGVVQDEVTSLLWQGNVDSQVRAWADSVAYCNALLLGGRDDWRLPTAVELVSIVNVANRAPAIDTAAFLSTPSEYFWTSTKVANSDAVWWAVNFDTGFVNDNGAAGGSPHVRCVSSPFGVAIQSDGGPNDGDSGLPGSNEAASDAGTSTHGAPPGQYVATTDTVYDTKTKLTWQRSPEATLVDWNGASTYCAMLDLQGESWRLPTVNELVTLIDYGHWGPAIDESYFPGTPTDFPEWTSSPFAGDPTQAWEVSPYSGNMFYADTASPYYARCVH